MTNSTLPKIDLFCTTGGASKEYHLFTIDHADGTYTLFYANGAIGAAMKPKVKAGPAPFDVIKKEFDKTVKSKISASPAYTEASSGVSLTTTQDAGDQSGWMPHLLTEVDDDGLEALLKDDRWLAQEKINGERRAVLIEDDAIRGANKKGRFIGGVPTAWAEALKTLPPGSVLDGEHVGDTLYVFDVPRWRGVDTSDQPYSMRLGRVKLSVAVANEPTIRMAEVATGEVAKRELLATVTSNIGEGIVFTRADSTYVNGRSSANNSGRIKYKLYEFSNCVVLHKNAGRSVALGLYDAAGAMVNVGSVTIPPNQEIPSEAAVLRVRYMHMFDGGSLYGPPVSFGVVSGVNPEDCTLAQVKRVIAKSSALRVDADDYFDEEPEVAAAVHERPRGQF